MATVKSLAIEDVSRQVVFAGDQAAVTLAGVDMQNVAIGYILCDPQMPVPIASKFQTRIVIFNVTVPITKGFPVSNFCCVKVFVLIIISRWFFITSHWLNRL